MKDLLDIRKDIDKIDEQIVKLYEERMKLTSDVAEYKINTGKQVFDKEREESKLATLQKKAESDFTRHGIRELFEQIMAMSRKKQYKLLTEHGIMPPQEFEPIHTLDYSNARIVFQGLEGAYSQLAMEQFFGENCNNFHVESWKDAMEPLRTGKRIMRYSRSRILRQELSRKIMIFWWNMIIILSGSRSSVLIMHF